MAMRGFPYTTFPRGWYQVAWSHELKQGDVRPARYFGSDLVIYRTEGGSVVALDAICHHMGAHLGHGGTVCGTAIQCPFHGWRWDADGSNVDIPYSRQKPVARRLRVWPTAEKSGLVFLYYDPSGEAPDFEPPPVPEFDDPGYYPIHPHGTASETVPFPPQLQLENAVDMAHMKYVHHWDASEPSLDLFENRGNSFQVQLSGSIRTPRGETRLHSSLDIWSVGLIYTHLTGLRDMGLVSSQIPVDHDTSEMRLSVAMKRKEGHDSDVPDSLAMAMIEAQKTEVLGKRPGGDRDIWEHMEYKVRPALVAEEAASMRALRKWAATFYAEPANSANRHPIDARDSQ